MFTGIIEALGEVTAIKTEGSNRHFKVKSRLSQELKVDQSLSHDGVCLTVTKVEGDCHWVTAIEETLRRSSLTQLANGQKVNLERCMQNNGRFDGHIVQGHVDQLGTVASIHDANGSWVFEIGFDPGQGNITVEKGSIAVNGVSLTCFHSKPGQFSVAIIPYTFQHTTFYQLRAGDIVNREFDIIGKYVKRLMAGAG